MTHKRWFQTAVAVIFTLVIILLLIQLQGLFSPIFTVIQTIFIPLLIGGVLFYLTRPILNFLVNHKFPKWSAILIIFCFNGSDYLAVLYSDCTYRDRAVKFTYR